MGEKKKSLCHDCLEQFEDMRLYRFEVISKFGGPAHFIGLCETCLRKEGHDPKNVETRYESIRRVNRQLGLGR